MEYYGTLGPACQSADTLLELLRAGMTGVRLNLSHGGLRLREKWLEQLNAAALAFGRAPKLMIDLRGPELRIGELPQPVKLAEGDCCRLGEGGIPAPSLLLNALENGVMLLIDDGALELEVGKTDIWGAWCVVRRGGLLKSNKSIAAPELSLSPPTLTEEDMENLKVAKAYGVSQVMLPFVRGKEDVLCLRRALDDTGGQGIRIFAKLENRAGVDALHEILPAAEHIVVARGDLGSNIPLWRLPRTQKKIAAACNRANIPFMVVTQLLHSMTASPVPTRAEVSDIFNAVLDGASSLMLTGETAVGAYPVEAMTYLVRTAEDALDWIRE